MTPVSENGERPVLSAVVFAYRNADTVLRSVASLLEQDADAPFEVVVATSGDDRTAELVRDRYPQVRVAASPTRLMPGGVRNLGMALARGDIVAFLEADCLAAPGWVRGRIACHRAGHGAVACAMAVTEADGLPGTAALYLTHPNRLRGHASGPAHPFQAYGLSFTREALDMAGPFDEMLRTDEDTAMAERVAFLGFDIWFEASVVRKHIGPSTLAGLLHDQYTRGQLDSWREVVTLPPGPQRPRFENRRGARTAVVVLRALRRAARRVRFTVHNLRGGQPGPRRELVALAPYLLAGELAYHLGWCVDQYRVVHRRRHAALSQAARPGSGIRRRVAASGARVVALTFDGAPSAVAPTLEVLKRLDVPAAFFVSGHDAEQRPQAVRAIADAGHVVASAGYSGTALTTLPDAALDDELLRSRALLEQLTGSAVRHVRPPGGVFDGRVVDRAAAQGYEVWLWTDHPASSVSDAAPAGDIDETTATLTPGAVLRVRLGGARACDTVPEAVEQTVRRVRAQGYRFVRIDEPPADPAA